MKCPTCGNNLQMEDESCPYCGSPNPFFQQHQEDMEYYEKQFNSTKEAVEGRSKRFISLTVKVTMIAVLVVLNIVMMFMMDRGSYAIWKSHVKKDIQAHATEYRAAMDQYEKDGRWILLADYYSEKSLDRDENFREYSQTVNAAGDYKMIYNRLMDILSPNKYNDTAYYAQQLSRHLTDFYRVVNREDYRSDYYDSQYTTNHVDAMNRMRMDVETLMKAYAGLTDEDLQNFPDYSEAKRASILEERIGESE